MGDLVEWDGIRRHCFTLWPYTRPLMLRLASQQSLWIEAVDEVPVSGFADDVIVVRKQDDEGRFLGRCVHEIAESLIKRGEWKEILRYGDARIPHQIAEIVERRFLRAYRFHYAEAVSAHEDHQRREGMQWPMGPETYVVDEFCDPELVLTGGVARRCRRA